DRSRDGPAIARQPEVQQGVERLHDDDEIARAQILFDKPPDGLAGALRSVAGGDVVLVEENGEEPRTAVRGFRPFVGARPDGLGRLARQVASVELHEPDSVDGLWRIVLEDLKLLGTEVVDDATALIRGDRVDADQ